MDQRISLLPRCQTVEESSGVDSRAHQVEAGALEESGTQK